MKRCTLFFLVFGLALSLSAAERQATAILLDNSKSISPSDFQKAKDLISQMLEKLPGTKLVYVFGTDMRKVEPSDFSSLQATESYTMIYDAAFDAAQELSSMDVETRALVIISDGNDTKSATVLEDVVSFANSNGIAVYGIGVSKANRKVLERMARLTGGKYFTVDSSESVDQIRTSVVAQKPAAKKEEPKATAIPQPQPGLSVASPPDISAPTESSPVSRFPYKWILIVLLGGALMLAVIFVLAKSYRTEPRVCPTCGRHLEFYQTICPVCSVPETRQTKQIAFPPIPSDGTQESGADHDDAPAIPMELLEKKPVTEEMLSKTFVLMETPMLVVRKGKNLGQTFSLNRAFPVSIGRSRVNEIRLEDITISGQHCRIIPENGKHVLYDLNSTNGTFLNDKKVNRSVLKEGDTIRVGETQFLYKIEQHRN